MTITDSKLDLDVRLGPGSNSAFSVTPATNRTATLAAVPSRQLRAIVRCGVATSLGSQASPFAPS